MLDWLRLSRSARAHSFTMPASRCKHPAPTQHIQPWPSGLVTVHFFSPFYFILYCATTTSILRTMYLFFLLFPYIFSLCFFFPFSLAHSSSQMYWHYY
jgi:hypothetical protein